MAGVFQDIELDWGGRVFTIKSHRVMGVLARIEHHITLSELQAYSQRGTAPLVKLCMAFGEALRYAGARVTDDEIYEKAFEGPEQQQAIMTAVMTLIRMMLPVSARERLENLMNEPDSEDEPGEPAGNSKATAAASSKKPTRRRSQKVAG